MSLHLYHTVYIWKVQNSEKGVLQQGSKTDTHNWLCPHKLRIHRSTNTHDVQVYKYHNGVTLSIHSKFRNKTAYSTSPIISHLLWKAVCSLSKQWDPFYWQSLSIAPGLVSKSLQTHLTLFKLKPLARKATLCCALLTFTRSRTRPCALTDLLKRRFSYILLFVTVQYSILIHYKGICKLKT